MKRTTHTPEQVIRKLREADGMLAEGMGIAEVARSSASLRTPITAGALGMAMKGVSGRVVGDVAA